jgi:hypothetical protein
MTVHSGSVDEELPVVAALLGRSGDTRQQLDALAARFRLRVITLTLGEGCRIRLFLRRRHATPAR